jgi:hypothetical protein
MTDAAVGCFGKVIVITGAIKSVGCLLPYGRGSETAIAPPCPARQGGDGAGAPRRLTSAIPALKGGAMGRRFLQNRDRKGPGSRRALVGKMQIDRWRAGIRRSTLAAFFFQQSSFPEPCAEETYQGMTAPEQRRSRGD